MSRAKHQESLNAVQLFPFVAVLLCTMGSLLVLLVGVARSSKVRAVEEAAAAKARAVAEAPVDQSLIDRISHVRQQIDRFKVQQGKASLQLQNEQLQLSHLEDHMRRLQDELESLKTAAAELNSLADAHIDDRTQGERELLSLNELIAERKAAIENLRKEKGKRHTYAILPFKTPNGTRRPPVYFECNNSQIVLQPDGIRFTVEDFRGPPGPGNPVAAAFRAAREQILQAVEAVGTDEFEPYALIIVRPGGQIACNRLQEVFDKSGIDFGYEIVESAAAITYPPADPQVVAAEIQAIQTARGRLEMLASAAPQLYDLQNTLNRYQSDDEEEDEAEFDDTLPAANAGGGDAKKVQRGSQLAVDSNVNYPGGGGGVRVTPVGQNSGGMVGGGTLYVAAVPTGGRPSGTGNGASLSSQESAGATDDPGSTTTGGTGPNGSLPDAAGSGGPVYRDGLVATQAGGIGAHSGLGREKGNGNGSFNGSGGGNANGNGNRIGGVSGNGGGNGSGNVTEDGGSAGGVEERYNDSTAGPPSAAGNTVRLNAPSNGQSGIGISTGEPVQFGNYDPHTMPANLGVSEKLAPSGESYGRPLPGQLSDNAADRHVHELEPDDMQTRKAKSKVRGKDWAIRGRTPGAVAIRRTIRVAVHGDSLEILPEPAANDEAGICHEVPLIGPTNLAREDLADTIEQRIHAWGMAGQGLYWRPVIQLVVAPDGQRRAEDLDQLLKNSGIEVRAAAVAQNVEGENVRASR
ncbi:MAG: hypothetical protein WD971_13675 [Pirellulales bacterium]